jgi:glycosyltransferase involved in cell wall biosynthesis
VNESDLIVLVGPAHPYRGGIAHFNESFARNLQKRGFRVKIVTFSLQYPSILFPGKSQKTSSKAPEDLDINRLINSMQPLSWKKSAKAIAKWSPKYVVIRFWIPFMGPALGTVAKHLQRSGITVIGLIDNAIPHESRPMDRSFSAMFFRYCHGFFTLSDKVANDIKTMNPDKPVDTSPHPIYDIFGAKAHKSEAMDRLNLDPSFRYVLFFGFIRYYKGLDLLIRAFSLSNLARENVKLLVAGEFYDNPKKYLQMVEDEGLKGSVIFHHNYIPDQQVKDYFAVASLVAQTYRNATQSGVTQIAYHFERPMLVTDVGGLAETIPDGKVGLVVEPNPEAIAKALVRFFRDDLEETFAHNTTVEKQKFSWEHFTSRFLSFSSTVQVNHVDQ